MLLEIVINYDICHRLKTFFTVMVIFYRLTICQRVNGSDCSDTTFLKYCPNKLGIYADKRSSLKNLLHSNQIDYLGVWTEKTIRKTFIQRKTI